MALPAEILEFLSAAGGSHSSNEIASAIGTETKKVSSALSRMVKDGRVTRYGDVYHTPVQEYVLVKKRSWKGNYSIVMAPMAIQLAEAFGGIAATTDNKSAMLRITEFAGRDSHLKKFLTLLDRTTDQALAELKEWQAQTREDRRDMTDMQRYLAHRAFLEDFGTKAATTFGK
jgi:DNA-binding Lrp family transcriptional regulator